MQWSVRVEYDVERDKMIAVAAIEKATKQAIADLAQKAFKAERKFEASATFDARAERRERMARMRKKVKQ